MKILIWEWHQSSLILVPILLGFQKEQSYRLNDLLRLGDVKYNERENEKFLKSKKIKEKGTLHISVSF